MPVRPISGVKPKSRAGWAVGLAAVVALALAGYVVLRRPSPPAPTVAAPSTPAGETAQRPEAGAVQKSLDEGKRLLEAGKYEESLTVFRTVLGSHPDNAEAKEFATKDTMITKNTAGNG